MSDSIRVALTVKRFLESGGNRQEMAPFTQDYTADQPHQSTYEIAASQTNASLPLGSSGESGLFIANFSHRVTLKADAGDTGFTVGPGLVILTSPTENYGNDSFLITTGSDVTTVTYFTMKVDS